MLTGGKSAGNLEAESKLTFRINQLCATSSPLPGTKFKYLEYIFDVISGTLRTRCSFPESAILRALINHRVPLNGL
jgi:hypothetical protein